MSRVQLDIPEELPFCTDLTIRITDLNYGAHLGNDRILSYVHEARARFLAQWNVTETDAFGIGMAMVDAVIQFKAEGFFGDKVQIWVGTGGFTAKSWDFYYRLLLPEKGKVLALAKTGMVGFDYTKRKVVALPEELRRVLGAV